MKNESGRSLIEVIGVMAITGVMTVAALGVFNMIRANQVRNIAIAELKQIAENTKILLEMRFFNPRKLGIIFGCGGDRDRGKRKIMGEIASRLADWVIITNDNTRSEDPEKIATMILEGVSNKNCCLKISDRREAIEFGIKNSGQEDIVVVAGRGHEDCLLLGSKKMHFIDREEVERNLQCY